DDVELPPLVEQQLDVAGRLEPGAEPALGLAHALGHGPDLAVVAGQQRDDAVGLAQLVRPEHDPLVVVERHGAFLTPRVRLRTAGRGPGTRGSPRTGAGGG